ncbi:hypothetical protein NDU88_005268 [Pleurodeles waltl]|uniref:Uncharacterized protein n=1 Tax=Pleurodeles waltl TaxID=8319 RepID=A0AAV7NLW7_PLEWA|nr:hypothetical protein NDU88_005268 [Pleurodeles waltl]
MVGQMDPTNGRRSDSVVRPPQPKSGTEATRWQLTGSLWTASQTPTPSTWLQRLSSKQRPSSGRWTADEQQPGSRILYSQARLAACSVSQRCSSV